MGIKLLIADDEDVVRNGISKYIQLHTDRFDKIYLAGNGREAVEIALKHKPNIILLDIQMPIKNGIEVMEEIDRANLKTVVIVLSGYDEFDYARQAIKYGAKDYLLKPTRSSDMLKKLIDIADEEFGEEEIKHKNIESTNYIVKMAQKIMEEHYYENLTQIQVAEKVGITAGYLSTLFSKNLRCGFVEYLNQIRIEHACAYLEQGYFKTYEIAYKVGFRDEKYFSKVFRKTKGMTPSEYRKVH